MKSIAQLITEGRSRWQAGSDYEASMARDLWLQDAWPHIEAKLRAAGDSGCPCLVIEPCDPHCTCSNPFMSYGCQRCATYGSIEQRKAQATFLANLGATARAAGELLEAVDANIPAYRFRNGQKWCIACDRLEGEHHDACRYMRVVAAAENLREATNG